MGEIADAMLDGTLCAGCGAYIGNDAGYPLYCGPACEPDRAPRIRVAKATKSKGLVSRDIPCPECRRTVTKSGLADHMLAKHPQLWEREQ